MAIPDNPTAIAVSFDFLTGLTTITWTDETGVSGETYRVYRHTVQITDGNKGSAQVIQEAIAEGTEEYEYTVPDDTAGNYYYAVTAYNIDGESSIVADANATTAALYEYVPTTWALADPDDLSDHYEFAEVPRDSPRRKFTRIRRGAGRTIGGTKREYEVTKKVSIILKFHLMAAAMRTQLYNFYQKTRVYFCYCPQVADRARYLMDWDVKFDFWYTAKWNLDYYDGEIKLEEV